ncbi:MAG TPA: hypothetical protein VF857_02595 [Spirochaetota bacterium]
MLDNEVKLEGNTCTEKSVIIGQGFDSSHHDILLPNNEFPKKQDQEKRMER